MRLDEPLKSVGETEILPDPEGLLAAVSRLGYSMEEALAEREGDVVRATTAALYFEFLWPVRL